MYVFIYVDVNLFCNVATVTDDFRHTKITHTLPNNNLRDPSGVGTNGVGKKSNKSPKKHINNCP